MASLNKNISNNNDKIKVNYDQFIDLFPATPRKKYRNGFYVLCPVHGDKNPSLLIEPSTNKDFSVSFKCWSGCKPEDILKSVNLTWNDIRINNNGHTTSGHPFRQIERVYDYKKDGQLLFQVVRTIPKGFFQRRPDGKGDYINSLEGIEPCLYHYDDVLKAISQGDIIFIPEGEKDAESLCDRGLIGTTSPMGAGPGKWLNSYTETLRNGRIVILIDNDKPGIEFGRQKLSALYGNVANLKLVELPGVNETIKDITDWFNAGHDTDELLNLVENTPEWTPDYETTKQLICLASVESVDISWLWYPYIAFGKLTIFEGDPGDGKSTATLAIAAGISRGASIGTITFPIGLTLLMSAEDGLADTIKPRLDKLEADCTKIFTPKELFTLDEIGLSTLEAYIKAIHPTLVVIDPIVAYLDKTMNMNQANQVRWVLARLAKLAETYNLALIVIRHLTKGNNTNAKYRGIGSIDFTAAARSVLLSGMDENTGERALIHTKSNLAPPGDSIGYKLVDGGLEWTGKSDMTYKDISSESSGAIDDAKAWLEQVLQDGDREAEWILTEGKKQHNLSPATLKRAKKLLNIESYSKPELGKKGAGKWYWNLPGVGKND